MVCHRMQILEDISIYNTHCINTTKLYNKTVLAQCLCWLSVLPRGWVLLVKEEEHWAYSVEGASFYVPINTVAAVC